MKILSRGWNLENLVSVSDFRAWIVNFCIGVYVKSTTPKKLDKDNNILLQEAVWLSSKASQMGTVKLHAVVKEDLDTEIEDFREFFKGEIHLDEKVYIF